MEIRLIKTILFRNSNGNDLRLTLGKIRDIDAYHRFVGSASNDDKGFRWRFVGPNIPMPVRAWFNGYPEATMVSWVRSQGYEVVTVTSHVTGSVYVVKGNETPVTTAVNPDDDSKGNEPYKLTELAIRNGNEALTEAIKLLCSQGMVLKAISLYRFVHHCCLKDAKEAVDKIRFP